MNIETIIQSAIETHLWCDVYEEDLITDIDVRDMQLDKASASRIAEDVRNFVAHTQSDLEASKLEDWQIGYDFALTRNGHGTGFWDRDLGEIGERLSEASKPFGTITGWVINDTVFFE